MYLLDNDTPPEVNKSPFSDYKSLDSLIIEMKTDREDVNIGTQPAQIDNIEQPPPLIPDVEPIAGIDNIPLMPKPPLISDKLRRFEAMFLAKNFDKVASIGCSFIADEDVEMFRCDLTDLTELCEYIYEWRKLSDEVIPPWLQLVIGATMIFFPKFKEALSIRKEKKKIIQLEARQEQMKKELKEMQAQARESEIERQELILRNIELQSKMRPDLNPEAITDAHA